MRVREDLHYRLRGATITVPPLRDRLTDLPAMIDAFLREATIRGRVRKLPVTPEAMRLLAAYACRATSASFAARSPLGGVL